MGIDYHQMHSLKGLSIVMILPLLVLLSTSFKDEDIY